MFGFLTTSGNNISLKKSIENSKVKLNIIEDYPLYSLIRRNSPEEEGLKWQEKSEVWFSKIHSLATNIVTGLYSPTPLLLFDKWENNFTDGSHILEALQILGFEKYYLINIKLI